MFVCDALKGFLAVQLGFMIARGILGSSNAIPPEVYRSVASAINDWFVAVSGIVAALACILGHNFPVWLRFRGGKGVATTVGTLLGLMPLAVLVVAVIWAVAFYTLRYVSVASILAATALPLVVWALGAFHYSTGGTTGAMLCFSVVAAALVWWRHRGNIQRLLNGTEPRSTRKA